MLMADYFRKATSAREGIASRYSDLLLVVAIIAIVAMMVLPLPAWLIDVLVAINIAVGVILLLLGVYIASPLEFSAFPSVLLLTTLFRLSVSIATTRMILLHGEGGHIIDTFGKTVAGGNLVVGLVVFLIITVVQFIVIAKGAERVAEVAARFSLDAMPGKQLSIDSDLRSGLIDKDEARRRRRTLEQESKLHGSLDGAMKFVKGDAIAGIVIIAINLLGGLGVGVMMQDLDFGTAITKYSILTIGDGMVAQIPALLGAMAAGLIVTRTTDEEDRHLGDAIRKQIGAKPRGLLVAGGICLLLMLVPGFPKPVFAALAFVFGVAGAVLNPAFIEWLRNVRNPTVQKLVGKMDKPQEVTSTANQAQRASVPLLLRVPSRLLAGGEGARLTATLQDTLDSFNLTLGLHLPKIHVFGHEDQGADQGRWELLAFEVPIAAGPLPEEPALELGAAIRDAVRRNAGLFIGAQDTTNMLTRASAEMPDIVKEVARGLPLQRVAEVFRRLVGEGVSIRNMRDILEALAEISQREKDVHAVAEFTRVALRRQISHQVAPSGQLAAVMLQPALEEVLRKAIRVSAGVSQLALDPDAARAVSETIAASVNTHKPAAVLTSIDVRFHVRKLIEQECFDTPVLSYHELMPTLKLDVLDRIASPVAGGSALRAA
ncbi:MAG TPA: FHIPEP family type III secretion protein [Burkholderiaceae bacterium]|nr:FHIPEP family type III secretion protein [Burkholderiaceae bacterium]